MPKFTNAQMPNAQMLNDHIAHIPMPRLDRMCSQLLMRRFWLNLSVWMGCLLLATSCKQKQMVNETALPPHAHAVPTVGLATAPDHTQIGAWKAMQPGVEWRSIQVKRSTIRLVRIDSKRIRVRVAYAPYAPRKVSEWMSARHPLVVINGGYFEADYKASALTISDGVVSGHSYQGFGGMLAVDTHGTVTLRSLAHQPYTFDQNLIQAVQAFPRLLWERRAMPIREDGKRARRTAMAIDSTDRLLLIVNDKPTWTLTELSQWLETCGLGIVNALNLDGGPSTGLAISTPAAQILFDSETVVPQIVMIEAR